MNGVEQADAAVADQFAGLAEPGVGPLLAACLEDAFFAGHGITQDPPLVDRVGQGFLDVGVLAVAHGVERSEDMPVVGRANQHGIDVVAAGDFAKVAVSGAIRIAIVLVDRGHDRVEVGLVDVAHREDLDALMGHEILHDAHAASARANQAQGDAVAGRVVARGGQGGRRHERGKRGRRACCRGGFQEGSPVESRSGGHAVHSSKGWLALNGFTVADSRPAAKPLVQTVADAVDGMDGLEVCLHRGAGNGDTRRIPGVWRTIDTRC